MFFTFPYFIFFVRLELLPESHVSPRIASKIIFCGKAVKLLLSANKTANAADMPQLRDIFTYLSTGPSPSSGTPEVRRDTSAQSGGPVLSNRKKSSTSPTVTTTDGDENNGNNGNFTPLKKGVINQKNVGINEDNETTSKPFAEHFERCGFERKDIERFTACFLKVLMEPHLALQSFESLVEDVHSLLSSKLWTLLRDQFGFTNFLLSIRNTYLMGKGELYQLILDGVLEQTHKPAPDSQKADNVLKWDIIRGAGKTLNLDDDSLASTIAIRVNISSLTITDFNAQSCTVCIAGGAQYELSKPVAIGKKRINRYVSLCTIIEEDSSAELSKLWSTHVLRKSSDLGIKDPGSRHTGPIGAESTPEKGHSSDVKAGSARAKYTQGAVWLPDQKYVAKGFTVNSVFECDWLSVRNSVTLSHPNIVNSTPTIVTDDSEHLQIACCERSILSAAESLQAQAQSAPTSKGKSDPSSGSLGGGRNDPGPVPITPKGSKPSRIRRGANGHLLLGGLSCVVHSDRQVSNIIHSKICSHISQNCTYVCASVRSIIKSLYEVHFQLKITTILQLCNSI